MEVRHPRGSCRVSGSSRPAGASSSIDGAKTSQILLGPTSLHGTHAPLLWCTPRAWPRVLPPMSTSSPSAPVGSRSGRIMPERTQSRSDSAQADAETEAPACPGFASAPSRHPRTNSRPRAPCAHNSSAGQASIELNPAASQGHWTVSAAAGHACDATTGGRNHPVNALPPSSCSKIARPGTFGESPALAGKVLTML